METARVNIVYRPVRVAWAIHSADRESFRTAMRYTHTMWGGRFNPVIFVDQPEQSKQLIEAFRVDHIIPIGDAPAVVGFPHIYPHLIDPIFGHRLFYDGQDGTGRACFLDVHNALLHWSSKPEWREFRKQGFRKLRWQEADALSDALLMQFGGYPEASEINIDYGEILSNVAPVSDIDLPVKGVISAETLKYPGISYLSKLAIKPHWSVKAGWKHPGFFLGRSEELQDLVACWNVRAADNSIVFVDIDHGGRYSDLIAQAEVEFTRQLAGEPEFAKSIAVWSRTQEHFENAAALLGDGVRMHCLLDAHTWNGLNLLPPTMYLGEATSLGVIGEREGNARISFALNDKPFHSDAWFHTQNLVATFSTFAQQKLFEMPYVPELNEPVARSMGIEYNKLRIEPKGMGIIIDAADHDLSVQAYAPDQLIKQVFALAGLDAKLSSGGLIARQLISRLGGADGGRAFKIPGVRRLLKTYGPTVAFSEHAALQAIGQSNPTTGAKFSDHANLYIEPRASGNLTPQSVFGHLVEKGLFRIGSELTCPSCNLTSWTALDNLKQNNSCELCGTTYDSTRQLVGTEFKYRRTGILGVEKNTQGAIPVVLTLQQLSVNMSHISGGVVLAPSYDLIPRTGVALPKCETDFVVIQSERYPDKASVIIGECKDEGDRINQTDIDNLGRVSDAMPKERFDVYILLARLSPFNSDEVALARSLNGEHVRRVILLSNDELEPYHMYERANARLGTKFYGFDGESMANATDAIYFRTTSNQ